MSKNLQDLETGPPPECPTPPPPGPTVKDASKSPATSSIDLEDIEQLGDLDEEGEELSDLEEAGDAEPSQAIHGKESNASEGATTRTLDVNSTLSAPELSFPKLGDTAKDTDADDGADTIEASSTIGTAVPRAGMSSVEVTMPSLDEATKPSDVTQSLEEEVVALPTKTRAETPEKKADQTTEPSGADTIGTTVLPTETSNADEQTLESPSTIGDETKATMDKATSEVESKAAKRAARGKTRLDEETPEEAVAEVTTEAPKTALRSGTMQGATQKLEKPKRTAKRPSAKRSKIRTASEAGTSRDRKRQGQPSALHSTPSTRSGAARTRGKLTVGDGLSTADEAEETGMRSDDPGKRSNAVEDQPIPPSTLKSRPKARRHKESRSNPRPMIRDSSSIRAALSDWWSKRKQSGSIFSSTTAHVSSTTTASSRAAAHRSKAIRERARDKGDFVSTDDSPEESTGAMEAKSVRRPEDLNTEREEKDGSRSHSGKRHRRRVSSNTGVPSIPVSKKPSKSAKYSPDAPNETPAEDPKHRSGVNVAEPEKRRPRRSKRDSVQDPEKPESSTTGGLKETVMQSNTSEREQRTDLDLSSGLPTTSEEVTETAATAVNGEEVEQDVGERNKDTVTSPSHRRRKKYHHPEDNDGDGDGGRQRRSGKAKTINSTQRSSQSHRSKTERHRSKPGGIFSWT